MKRKLIALFVSSVLVGIGIVYNLNQDTAIPSVKKLTEDASTSVSKHENIDKKEESNDVTETEKSESEESKKKSTEKSESKVTLKKQTSTSKSDAKGSVSSEGQNKNSKKENPTKSSSSSDQKASTSNSSSTSSKSNDDVVSQPVESKQEPVVEQTATLVPVEPSYACPGGVDQNQACDVILDSNSYYATFSSEGEANSSGEYYLNDVMYIGEVEITNYSVQPIYRNDHSIAYYGLNLWSNGSLIN